MVAIKGRRLCNQICTQKEDKRLMEILSRWYDITGIILSSFIKNKIQKITIQNEDSLIPQPIYIDTGKPIILKLLINLEDYCSQKPWRSNKVLSF